MWLAPIASVVLDCACIRHKCARKLPLFTITTPWFWHCTLLYCTTEGKLRFSTMTKSSGHLTNCVGTVCFQPNCSGGQLGWNLPQNTTRALVTKSPERCIWRAQFGFLFCRFKDSFKLPKQELVLPNALLAQRACCCLLTWLWFVNKWWLSVECWTPLYVAAERKFCFRRIASLTPLDSTFWTTVVLKVAAFHTRPTNREPLSIIWELAVSQ